MKARNKYGESRLGRIPWGYFSDKDKEIPGEKEVKRKQ